MTYRIICRSLFEETELESARLTDCPSLVRAYILDNDIPAREWLAGEVYQAGELITRLAYNGAEIE